jgi:hypothetical protein
MNNELASSLRHRGFNVVVYPKTFKQSCKESLANLWFVRAISHLINRFRRKND